MAGLAPCPPAARPTPAQLAVAKAKAKPLLVPKAKPKPPTSHLQEQKRRMEWVRLYKAAEEDVNSLGQVAFKVANKVDGFDGSGTPDPFNQNDDDQGDEAASGSQGVWAGEVWGILDDDDDDSLVQGASKVAKKDDGFDGSGTPYPFNQNDDDPGDEAASGSQGVWAGEVPAWVKEWQQRYDDDDDSLVQVASKVAKKGEGSQGVWGFLEDDKEPSGDGDGDGAGEEKQKQPEGDGDADEDEEGYADLARAVPTKFLLQELAQRCTR